MAFSVEGDHSHGTIGAPGKIYANSRGSVTDGDGRKILSALAYNSRGESGCIKVSLFPVIVKSNTDIHLAPWFDSEWVSLPEHSLLRLHVSLMEYCGRNNWS